MSKENFIKCLKEGQQTEFEFKELLEQKGYTVELCNNADFDLKAINGDEVITYEIKTDQMAQSTKNVAIEVSKVIDNVLQPCGVMISKADFYVYKIIREKNFFIIKTADLKKYCESKDSVSGGDRNAYNVVLLKLTEFINICDKVPRKKLTEFELPEFLKKRYVH